MTLNQLIYFEKVAEIENMGLAANLLHIAQPSLSISISNLEKELNLTLFNRVGHKLFLTLDGQQFLAHTKKILAEVQETQIHMRSLSADRDVEVRIGCISPVLYDYLPRNIREFQTHSKIKDIKFDFITDFTPRLIQMLKEGYFDFVLCSRSSDGELGQELVFSERLVLLCPVGAYVPGSWGEILGQTLIDFQEISSFHDELHLLLDRHGLRPVFVHKAPDEESVASLVAHGFGYAICPLVDILEKMNVRIVPLPEPNEDFVRRIYLTQLIRRPPIGNAQKFFEYLRQNSRIIMPPKTLINGVDNL